MKKIKAFAPASMANFIVGFDTLGAALSPIDDEFFGDIVTLEENEEFCFDVKGPYAHKLPSENQNNIIVSCCDIYHRYLIEKGIKKRNFHINLSKRLPVGSGLGSSASSIVATLLALNNFYGEVFSRQELLVLAGKMEGEITGTVHYDNVAPSLLGGLQLMIAHKNKISATLPFFDDWYFIVYYPGIEITTRLAREILPKNFELHQVTLYWQKLASFVHGLYQQEKDLVKSLLQDHLIEPYRLKLIPNIENVRSAAFNAGAMVFGLSGSGPTCFALSDSISTARTIQLAIENVMPIKSDAFIRICTLDKKGACLMEDLNDASL